MQDSPGPCSIWMFTEGHPDQADGGQHAGDQQTQRAAPQPRHRELDVLAITPVQLSAPSLPWSPGSTLVEQQEGEGI